MTARDMALEAMEDYRRRRRFIEQSVGDVLDKYKAGDLDRAQCTELCYGCVQHLYTLDYLIDVAVNLGQRQHRKLEPKIRDIMRLSLYQIRYTNTPDPVAISEGVNLCTRHHLERAKGLVNASLRTLGKSHDRYMDFLLERPVEERLSLVYSCPRPLVARFLEDLGEEETEALLKLQNEPTPVYFQCNTLKISCEELQKQFSRAASYHPWLPDCLVCPRIGSMSRILPYWQGLCYVQDPAARLAVVAAQPRAGMRVLDLCAAPGGKSFACAIAMGDKGSILACDVSAEKVPQITQGAKRMGMSCITAQQQDATVDVAQWHGKFDLVIADVPCSGLGVIRKKPDIRYKEPAEFLTLPPLQMKILRRAAAYVRPGGVLLYSTCTLRHEENQDIISAFLSPQSSLAAPALLFADDTLGAQFRPEDFRLPGDIVSENGQVTLYPQRNGTDGFFICKLRRAR